MEQGKQLRLGVDPAPEPGRWEVRAGDCVELLRAMPEASVDSIVTDPPYGLEFMGKEWDKLGGDAGTSKPGIGDRPTEWPSFGGQEFGGANPTCATCGGRLRGERRCSCEAPDWRIRGERVQGGGRIGASLAMQEWHHAWAVEALRVLKPGGHLLAFGGTRTWHRLACALEDAGFEVRDTLCWCYGSGFPKSLDISKALKKNGDDVGAVTWKGFGTALKPAWEPILVCRKPLSDTVAANVRAHGVGGINVDGCRVGTSKEVPGSMPKNRDGHGTFGAFGVHDGGPGQDPHVGRWPANLILGHHPDCRQVGTQVVKGDDRTTLSGGGRDGGGFADVGSARTAGEPGGRVFPTEIVPAWACHPDCPTRCFPETKSSKRNPETCGKNGGGKTGNGIYSDLKQVGYPEGSTHGDAGSAARFFQQCADDDPEDAATRLIYVPKASRADRNSGGIKSTHPTVKPTALMRYLVRLVTPRDGLVLDPFCGSGSTGKAALLEGFRFLGLEREAEYVRIAEARLRAVGGEGARACAGEVEDT